MLVFIVQYSVMLYGVIAPRPRPYSVSSSVTLHILQPHTLSQSRGVSHLILVKGDALQYTQHIAVIAQHYTALQYPALHLTAGSFPSDCS